MQRSPILQTVLFRISYRARQGRVCGINLAGSTFGLKASYQFPWRYSIAVVELNLWAAQLWAGEGQQSWCVQVGQI